MSTPAVMIGIDVGTQGLRAGAYTTSGDCLGMAKSPYGTRLPRPGWAEQSATDWWKATVSCTWELLKSGTFAASQVIGIGVDGTSCTVVPVDDRGVPLRPALLWMDVRAGREAEELTRTHLPCVLRSGGTVSAEWMIPKALWIKRHEPEVYEKAFRFAEPPDLMVYWLTGEWVTSIANAVHKCNYSAREEAWPLDLLAAAGLPELREKWPARVLRFGEAAGVLSSSAAAELGLKPGITVTHLGPDAHAGMLGLGVTRPGRLTLTLGTSTTLLGLCPEFIPLPGVWGPFLDGLLPGSCVIDAGQISTGAIIEWFLRTCQSAPGGTGGDPFTSLTDQAERLPIGSEGLLLLDHFQGCRTPHNDPSSRGVLAGLSLIHTPAHIYRAILEGTAYGARRVVDTLQDAGVTVSELRASGGGARNRLWLQIHADVTGLPVLLTKEPQASCLGCAAAAAVAAGAFESLLSATERMVRVVDQVEPDAERGRAYLPYYARYCQLYPRLADLLHDLVSRQASPD